MRPSTGWRTTLVVGALGCAWASCSREVAEPASVCEGESCAATSSDAAADAAPVPTTPRVDATTGPDATTGTDAAGAPDGGRDLDAAGPNPGNLGGTCGPGASCDAGLACYHYPTAGWNPPRQPPICLPYGMPPCVPGGLFMSCAPSDLTRGPKDAANTCCAPLAGTDLHACQSPAREAAYCTCTVPATWGEPGAAPSCVDQDCPEKVTGDAPAAESMASDGQTLFLSLTDSSSIVGLPLGPSLHVEGTPLPVLATDQPQVTSLAHDAGTLYWLTSGGTAIAMPATGGTPTPLAGIEAVRGHLAVSGGYIYWMYAETVSRRWLAGGPTVQLSASATRMVVSSAGALVSETGGVVLYPEDGGAARTIAPTQGYNAIAMDDANAYFTIDEDVDSGCLRVTTLYKAPLSGGARTVLAQSRAGLMQLLTDGGNLYWTGAGGIFTMPSAGGAPRMLVATENTRAMLVSGDSLYWSDRTNIYKRDLR
ncbi:MAG: hypothetical protein FJ104_02515 [Deltaproteobacteria bacterium]|nr:hypothetical protein [Deltaproteobacteria bacterium]